MTTHSRDELTGVETTGHEWDGIRELNNPLPKWWLYIFYACIAAALVYSVFVPPIPGVQGIEPTARAQLRQEMAAAHAAQAVYLDRIAAESLKAIRADKSLREFAMAGGAATFAENCAPCHGQGGAGSPGFPSLADNDWLWGGTLADIQQTIQHGIRANDDQTRQTEMPAFGRDGMLTPTQIGDVADYVLSLSGKPHNAAGAARGAQVFADNCAACHGEKGGGNQSLGAPALNDAIWLYGGTKAAIVAQVTNPRLGVMPAWIGRLNPTTIKMLTIYVHTLGGGQ